MGFIRSKYQFSSLQWVILIGLLLSRIGTSMMMPFFAIFLTYELGMSYTLAGFVTGVSFISYLIGGLLGGALSDRYGRNSIFNVSLCSYALTFFMFAIIAKILQPSPLLTFTFCIINLLAGLNRSCIDTLGQAILADLAMPEQKTALFSFRYTMVNIGNGLGPLLGTLLGFVGTVNGFYIAGGFCFIYFLLFLVYARRENMSKTNISNNISKNHFELKEILMVLYQDHAMCLFLLGGILITMVYSQLESTLGLILTQKMGNTNLFALLMTVNAFTVVVLQIPVTGYFLKRYSMLNTMRLGCLLIGLGLIGNAFSEDKAYLYIASQIIFTLGEILIFPVNAMFVEFLAPASLRGSYFGAMSLLQLGRAVGPTLGGFFLQYTNANITLIAFAIMAVATTWIYNKGNQAVTSQQTNLINN